MTLRSGLCKLSIISHLMSNSFKVEIQGLRNLVSLCLDIKWAKQLPELTDMPFPGYNPQIWLR